VHDEVARKRATFQEAVIEPVAGRFNPSCSDIRILVQIQIGIKRAAHEAFKIGAPRRAAIVSKVANKRRTAGVSEKVTTDAQ